MASKLFIFVGPSGVGKSTLISELRKRQPDFCYSISCTTRAPRPGEIDGVHYYFLDKESFSDLVHQNLFLEWKKVYGNFYGTPKTPILDEIAEGKNFLLDIDLQGYKEVKKNMPEAAGILILPPSLEELSFRLMSRMTDSELEIQSRLSLASVEIIEGRSLFEYQVINDELLIAVTHIENIIKKETLT